MGKRNRILQYNEKVGAALEQHLNELIAANRVSVTLGMLGKNVVSADIMDMRMENGFLDIYAQITFPEKLAKKVKGFC